MNSYSTKSLTEDLRAAKSRSMRLQILNVASHLLSEQGPQELSMRKLAQALGMSTIVLYTYFQDKQEILDQLYQEGFTRLQHDLLAVPSQQEAMAYVMELGRAYRRSAVTNSTYYQIMFTRCVPGFNPSASSRESSRQAFAILVAGVQRCIDEKVIQISGAAHATNIAQVLWGTLHGVISLELFGYLGASTAGEALLEQAIQTLRTGFQTHPHPNHKL